MALPKHEERENLFTKKAASVFFTQAREQAEALGEVAVVTKGFEAAQKNLVIDDAALKTKSAAKEHTIQDWETKCQVAFVHPDVIAEWSRIAQAMNDVGKQGKSRSLNEESAGEMLALMETELKTVHDVMGKKWREAHSKEESVKKAFAILFGLTMVFEMEEHWLLYGLQQKAAINKQFKVLGASWKKVLSNDCELLGVTPATLKVIMAKLEAFNKHINHVEGLDIKFQWNGRNSVDA